MYSNISIIISRKNSQRKLNSILHHHLTWSLDRKQACKMDTVWHELHRNSTIKKGIGLLRSEHPHPVNPPIHSHTLLK